MSMQEPEPMVPQEATYEQTESAEQRRATSNEAAANEQPSSKELLSKVLVETLSRRREDSDGLIEHLRKWRATLAQPELNESMLAGVVGQVLLYRMGPEAESIPENLRQEVGGVLWNDPDSQSRLHRLWANLESRP